jgi:hypothetical protein
MSRTLPVLVVLCAGALLSGAGCYSFTGASVPPHLETIAIPTVDDRSGFGEPGLREQFTIRLTDLFIADNSLAVTDRNKADCLLEGAIISVVDEAAVVTGEETVSTRRITMTVRFAFQDMKLRRQVWEKTFSQWGDFPSGVGASQRRAGVDEAMRKLTEDILLETVSGW